MRNHITDLYDWIAARVGEAVVIRIGDITFDVKAQNS